MFTRKKEILVFGFWMLMIVDILWLGHNLVNQPEANASLAENTKGINRKKEIESTFYYNQLTEEQQKAYETLRNGLMDRNTSIMLEDCDSDALLRIWEAVLMDHPEIFWVNEFSYQKYMDDSVSCEVLPGYCYTLEEIKERQAKIEEFTDEFINGISSRESDYNKILYTYETIIHHTDYDLNAMNNQHIDSVILGKASVCAGYAKTTKYLLNKLGVECVYVVGDVVTENGGAHAWTIVTCEGDTYFVDTTWGDPVYNEIVESGSDIYLPEISYDYLCCNEEHLFKTHEMNADFEMPSCTSLEWNYYVVNGRYFTEYNSDEIFELIEKDISNQQKTSVFVFSNSAVYEQAKDDMINVQLSQGKALYDETYGTGGTSCYYQDDEMRNKIVFIWE